MDPSKNHEHNSCDLQVLQIWRPLIWVDGQTSILIHARNMLWQPIIKICLANLWHRLVGVFAIVRIINACKNMTTLKNKYETLWNMDDRSKETWAPWTMEVPKTCKCCWQASSKLQTWSLRFNLMHQTYRPENAANMSWFNRPLASPHQIAGCLLDGPQLLSMDYNGLNVNPGTIWLKGKKRWSQ